MNYKCTECGTAIFNTTEQYDECPNCAHVMTNLKPIIENKVNVKKMTRFIVTLMGNGGEK